MRHYLVRSSGFCPALEFLDECIFAPTKVEGMKGAWKGRWCWSKKGNSLPRFWQTGHLFDGPDSAANWTEWRSAAAAPEWFGSGQITRSSWWCLEIFSGVLDRPICFISHSTSAGWRHQQPPTMQWGSNWQDVGCCYLILIEGRDIESDSIRLTTDISDSESAILYQYQSIYINISVYQFISISIYQQKSDTVMSLVDTNDKYVKSQMWATNSLWWHHCIFACLQEADIASGVTIGDWRQS